MSQFAEAIKTLKPSQRLYGFLFLVFITSTTAIITSYFKTDDCRSLMEENIRMHEDFSKISSILRQLRVKESEVYTEVRVDTSMAPEAGPNPTVKINEGIDYGQVINEIESIASKK